ncbi:uncharacterized protein [Nicotiana tomentosiformis]|uniref:uncharacterized protein n=1 Tax=Nicotiana tomentosiformis TaxID=4098 RepID=UPI00051ADDEB|nr:uncharacterized protein LOC104106895 [Nicotiana tomentosiformis]XP_009613844.1 uncharacterized protein LOC104106895 [Nicotiana tomentosiformis]
MTIEEDQEKMKKVDVPCLFNEVQQALNWASVLHHERFLRYCVKVNQLELELKEQAQKRDTYKILIEQQDGVIKDLQAELDRAQKEASVLRHEHADLVKKVQQKIDQIDQLRKEMDEIQVMLDGWKSKIDMLASEKETA